LAERLDGIYRRGLSQEELEDFARRCAVKVPEFDRQRSFCKSGYRALHSKKG